MALRPPSIPTKGPRTGRPRSRPAAVAGGDRRREPAARAGRYPVAAWYPNSGRAPNLYGLLGQRLQEACCVRHGPARCAAAELGRSLAGSTHAADPRAPCPSRRSAAGSCCVSRFVANPSPATPAGSQRARTPSGDRSRCRARRGRPPGPPTSSSGDALSRYVCVQETVYEQTRSRSDGCHAAGDVAPELLWVSQGPAAA